MISALNTSTYTSLQLGLMLLCYACWVVLFLMVVRNIRRYGVVEIPAAAVASNFAFATVWGLYNATDLGALYVWIMRGALLLEFCLFAYVLMNGVKHIRLPEIRQSFKAGMIVSYLCWLAMLTTFARQHYDVPTGLVSAFIVSLFMSAQYLFVELSGIEPRQYSLVAGWAKLLANGSAATFCVLVYPSAHFLLSLCAITAVLDIMYLLLFRRRRLSQPSRAPA